MSDKVRVGMCVALSEGLLYPVQSMHTYLTFPKSEKLGYLCILKIFGELPIWTEIIIHKIGTLSYGEFS